MAFRTDLKPLRAYRFIFGTSKPDLYLLRVTAKLLIIPINAFEVELRPTSRTTLENALHELEFPLHVPIQCIENGSVLRAKEELLRWASEHGWAYTCGFFVNLRR